MKHFLLFYEASMIARVWSAHATATNARRYRDHFADHVLPELKGIDGYTGAVLLTRSDDHGVEILVTTWWRSLEAIGAFAGTDLDQAVIADAAKALLTTWDERVRHYEMVVHDQVLHTV